MSGDNNQDFLTQAVQAQTPLQQLMAPRPYSPADIKHVQDDANAKAAEAAELAREKVAQENLLANPAEMRRLFPQVYKDVSLNHNDHLDLAEIQKGLDNTKLPQEERNFLKVMEYGYDNFRWQGKDWAAKFHHFDLDRDGVSAASLAMLNKAADRKIAEDPYFSAVQTSTLIGSFVVNGVLGGAISRFGYGDSWMTTAAYAAASGLIGAAWNEGTLYYQRNNGSEDKMYDEIKTGYQSFVSDYHNGKIKPPAPVLY